MLLHLSDLHFGTENVACMLAVQQLCESMRPEAVVVSGDLTQRARYAQFYACKHFLDSLNLPYLVVPGNHDIPLYHLWNRFLAHLHGINCFLDVWKQFWKPTIFM